MIKLDEKNIVGYLKQLKIFEGVDWDMVKATEVKENTNVNFVFVITLNSPRYKKIYIKQAFDFVKIAPDFPAPIDRQEFEKLSIDYLQRFWEDRIPQVIHYDKKNNILIITDMGQEAKLLADEIKNGQLHFEIGADLGTMMAELHVPTFDKDDYPVRGKQANEKHVDFIFDFRLRGAREEASNETNKLFKLSKQTKTSMIYGDWASKNIFVAGNKIRLVDFENLVRFDPAFDIGYALAHWVLDISQDNQLKMIEFFEDFEQAYSKNWSQRNELSEVLNRASKYTDAMMLHRLAGIKNTNRMEEYLTRDVDLVGLAKNLAKFDHPKPSVSITSLSF